MKAILTALLLLNDVSSFAFVQVPHHAVRQRRPQRQHTFLSIHRSSADDNNNSVNNNNNSNVALFMTQTSSSSSSSSSNSSSSSSNNDATTAAKTTSAETTTTTTTQQALLHDGEALQLLFAQQCDTDGLMTKQMLMDVPAIQELLDDGDLLMEELNDIWDAAPKFPESVELVGDNNSNNNNDNEDDDATQQRPPERIDVDSFIQIYRDIDDLFEEDLEEIEEEVEVIEEVITDINLQNENGNDNNEINDVGDDTEQEEELELTFRKLCNDNNKDGGDGGGLMSKQTLLEWEEISKLFQDGLLGRDEFEEIWTKTRKSPGSSDQLLDVEGFLSFNVALDDLFVFDDDEDEDNDDAAETETSIPTTLSSAPSMGMVEGDDLPPGVLFAALANDDYLVGMNELKRWSELQEMLADESLLPLELQNIYSETPKVNGDMLNEEGFTALYEAIDSLFEEVDDEENDDGQEQTMAGATSEAKTQLLALLSEMNSDDERLPCGLESTEQEETVVMDIVNQLEQAPQNLVRQKKGKIPLTDVAGSWELLYSSSSAMKFNKGLSGLGGSVPNGKFAGLIQNLQASKYMTDVEYIERIEVNPSSASFDVRVSGDWDLGQSVSLFTGEPSTVMTVEPARVMYGPTSTRADHWKSLGPMNMLDLTYLDDDLRIMRGSTATNAIFVFQRV